MRWNSLKGVPRGSKNGSGASIRILSGRAGVVTAGVMSDDTGTWKPAHHTIRFPASC